MAIPQSRNLRWSRDFVTDTLVSGRCFRILTLVDDFTRECLGLVVDTSLTGLRVARELDRIGAIPAYGSLVGGPSHGPIILQHAFQMLDTLRPGEPWHVIGLWMTVFGAEGQPILEGIGKIAGLVAGKITRVSAGHFAECRDISRKDR